MPHYPRYAIYFVPPAEDPLYRFGADLLGYDAYLGELRPFAEGVEAEIENWREFTADPRRYGFHATLKAPISLVDDANETQLISAMEEFAQSGRNLPSISPVVRLLVNFVAVVPSAPAPALQALAADCVTAFDRFRAPLTDYDRRRRNVHELTSSQIAHLDRWGYPYVFDDFRFHMTLTGKIAPDRHPSILSVLQRRFAALDLATISINRIALLRQTDSDSKFIVISSFAMNAGDNSMS